METESMEERLGKLEEKLARAERRYRLVLAGTGIVVLACAAIWVVLGAAGRAQAQNPGEAGKVIRASKFILEDEKGELRAVLGMTDDGPRLGLYDEAGESGVEMAVLKDGPKLALHDEKGQTRVELSIDDMAESALRMYDENGKARIWLVDFRDGPGLALCDENGPRAALALFKDQPQMSLYGKSGKPGAALAMGKDGSELTLYDEVGRTRAGLFVHKDNLGLALWNENGSTIWSAP